MTSTMFHATMLGMKSDADRGPVGAWARNARLAAGYPTAKRATEAANKAGISVTLQHIQGIESGWDRAGHELLLALGRLYGSEPPVSQRAAVPPGELDAIREAVAAGVAEGVARALDAIVRAEPTPPRRPRPRQ